MTIIVPEYKHAYVMIAGDVMLDRYWYGKTSRIAPEAPIPIVKIDSVNNRPGGAANVAVNIASLGANAHLIGLTGDDDAAHVLKKKLVQVNVKFDLITVPTHSTIIKLRVLSRNQQLIRLDFDEQFDNIDLETFYECISHSLKNVNVLVLSDYAKGTLIGIKKIIQTACKAGVLVLIDPKSNDFSQYRGATLLTPNWSEFEAAVGKCDNKKEIINRGMKLIYDFEFSAILITHSEQGMTLLQRDKQPLYMPTQAKTVCDVTGAGDTVIAVLAATLASGNTLEESCNIANIAAGKVISKHGTSHVSFTELNDSIHDCVKTDFGVMSSLDQLKSAVVSAKQRGEKVVMTNGVFDILHSGHVFYLANARKLGDRLIVAVNSDASAKRLKGHTRPINSLEQRMTVLSALESVDWVIAFEEDTPKNLISFILPDFLVKGEDYRFKYIAGSKEVWDNGGKVITLHLKNGFSTTNIIKKIQTTVDKQ